MEYSPLRRNREWTPTLKGGRPLQIPADAAARQSHAKHFRPAATILPSTCWTCLLHFASLAPLIQFTAGILIGASEYPSQRLHDLLFTPREGATTQGSSPGELDICCSALPGTSAPCGRESHVQWLGSLLQSISQ